MAHSPINPPPRRPMGVKPKDPRDRPHTAWLLAHVHHQGDDCLIWPFISPKGNMFVFWEGTSRTAASLMLFFKDGPPPPGDQYYCCHECNNGHLCCVNPKHLVWGSAKRNAWDRQEALTQVGKLKPDDVRSIRSLKGLLTQEELARNFGVTKMTINNVQSHRTWKFII